MENRFRLDGKVAIVTGASSGLGAALAADFAAAGAHVALGARRADRLQAVTEQVEANGGGALAVPTDVADPDACSRLVARAHEHFGRVDVLVNNAGVRVTVPATHETPEQFRSVVDVNLMGAYWMAQAAARVMQPGSSVINVSSVFGMVAVGAPFPQAAYSSSKAGLCALTRDLANQWSKRKGIRVNTISPGYFATEMTEELEEHPELHDLIRERSMLERLGDAHELTAAAIFLASDASSYITGVNLPVDGGLTAR